MCAEEIELGEWEYRGEGNGSIVVSLPERKQVLRLWKTGAAKRTCKDSLLARNKEVLLEQLDYSLHVVQRILGREHLILPQLVALSPRDAEHLRLSVRALRPESRREKELIPGNVYGILADDCAFMGSRPSSGPSWCVEIKAKQGVLPPDRQEPLCRFCLHQHMKMRKKKLEYMSPYCPFDLFSGCPWRTKEAVYGLLSSPQNNLKIFRDGKSIYGDERHRSLPSKEVLAAWFPSASSSHEQMENFGTLVTQALLLSSTWHRFYQVNVGNGEEGPCCGPSTCHAWKILDPKAKKRFLEMEAKAGGGTAPSHVLPPDCLLSTVLRMQSMVPPVPIEDLLLKYQELRDRREDLVKLLHGPFSHPLWSSVVKGLPPGPDDADEHLEAFREIQRFQISATANDCSLFLTFAPVGGPRNGFDVGAKEGRGYVRDASGSWYACQVKIIDVDPKSPDRISKYIRQDAESRALFCRLHPS